MANWKKKSSEVLSEKELKDLDKKAWNDLLNTKTTDEILDALGRGLWLKEHEAKPPPNMIPSLEDIRAYLEGPNNTDRSVLCDAVQAFSHWLIANRIEWKQNEGDKQAHLPREIIDNEGLVCYLMGLVKVSDNGDLQEVAEDLKPFAIVAMYSLRKKQFVADLFERVHQVWVFHYKNGYEGTHPLIASVEAWQKDVTAVLATKEHDRVRPAAILKHPTGSIRDVSLAEIGAGVLKRLNGHGQTPDAYQMALPGLEQESIIRPTQSLLVQERHALTTKSGAVSITARIFLEAVMALPGQSTKQRIKIILGDLIDFLNPNGKFHKRNQLPYILEALYNLNTNAVVEWEYNEKGNKGYWLPVVARSYPTMESDRDFPIVLDVELPPNSTQGPMVLKEAVRMTGKRSMPQFNAYLAISDVWDRYGTDDGRITDPTRPVERRNADGYLLDADNKHILGPSGRPLKNIYHKEAVRQLERERNPKTNRYPIFSNLDLIKAAYPRVDVGSLTPKEKAKYLDRSKKVFKTLKEAGHILIEEVAIEEVAEAPGDWRILPPEEHIQTYRALKNSDV